jgi:hypothetical protein
VRKPQPVNKTVVCSICGLDWEKHGKAPTMEKCVALLKAELAKRTLPNQFYHQTSGAIPLNVRGIPLGGDELGKAS